VWTIKLGCRFFKINQAELVSTSKSEVVPDVMI
jgi:hypothetical protein